MQGPFSASNMIDWRVAAAAAAAPSAAAGLRQTRLPPARAAAAGRCGMPLPARRLAPGSPTLPLTSHLASGRHAAGFLGDMALPVCGTDRKGEPACGRGFRVVKPLQLPRVVLPPCCRQGGGERAGAGAVGAGSSSRACRSKVRRWRRRPRRGAPGRAACLSIELQ